MSDSYDTREKREELGLFCYYKVLTAYKMIQADLRDIVGLVPDHYNKANIAVKQVTRICFPGL